MKFKIGDKLKALQWDRDLYGLEFVIITEINLEDEIYHWEAPNMGGVMHSGYRFGDAEKWIPKDEMRDNKLNKLL